jgi:hypothetical protein
LGDGIWADIIWVKKKTSNMININFDFLINNSLAIHLFMERGLNGCNGLVQIVKKT